MGEMLLNNYILKSPFSVSALAKRIGGRGVSEQVGVVEEEHLGGGGGGAALTCCLPLPSGLENLICISNLLYRN